jgi:hypothetical protein
MVYFLPKIPISECFGWPWNGKYWYILWPFVIFYGHLMYFMVYLSHFGMLYQEKSGNPGWSFCHRDMFEEKRKKTGKLLFS